MPGNKRDRLCKGQQPRKRQKMEETLSQTRKIVPPSFETIGTDMIVYIFSSFLDLRTIYRSKRINIHLYAIIDNNMNIMVRKVLILKNELNLADNLKGLRDLRRLEKLEESQTTDISRCLETYFHQIKMRKNICSLLVKFNNQKCIPSIEFIKQIVKNTINDHYPKWADKIKFRLIKVVSFTIAINISIPISDKNGLLNITHLKVRLKNRLVLNMHNWIATIDNKRTVLIGSRRHNETGILYNYPNSNIFGKKYQSLLYKINNGYDLPVLNTYFVVCNFIRGVNYRIIGVHHKKTRFTARKFPNKYESELFKLVGPNVCKRNIILRTKRQSILWMNRRFRLDKWTDEFPWEHIHICGSSILGALDPSLDESVYPIGDLDFFNNGRISHRRWYILVLEFVAYIKACNHLVSVNEMSYNDDDELTRVKYTIIWDGTEDWVSFDFVYVPRAATYPINAFDISLSQASFDGNNFYCTQSFKQSIITNTFTSCIFGGIKDDLEFQLDRVYKYVSRGYNLLVSTEMKDAEVCKIESVLERTNYEKYKALSSIERDLRRREQPNYIGLSKLTLDIYNIHDKFINMI